MPDHSPPANHSPHEGPKQQPTSAANGSIPNDGYWVHDAAGPRFYITVDAQGRPDLNALLAGQQRVIPGLDAATISIRSVGPDLVIDGQVASHDLSRKVAALITECAPGASVVNALVVADVQVAS